MIVQEQIPIVQGGDAEFRLKFRKENGDPFPLNAYDKVTLRLKGSSTNIQVTEVADAGSVATFVSPNDCGFIDVVIKADKTVELKPDSNADATIILDNSGTPAPKILNVKDLFKVEAPAVAAP